MCNKPSVAAWLGGQTPEMRDICNIVVDITRSVMPQINEFVYHNAIGFSLSSSPFDRICYINVPNGSYVNYGFFFGKDLDDPARLIQGSGKRIRHVKLYTLQDAGSNHLKYLIQQAAANAETDIQGWRNSLKRTHK